MSTDEQNWEKKQEREKFKTPVFTLNSIFFQLISQNCTVLQLFWFFVREGIIISSIEQVWNLPYNHAPSLLSLAAGGHEKRIGEHVHCFTGTSRHDPRSNPGVPMGTHISQVSWSTNPPSRDPVPSIPMLSGGSKKITVQSAKQSGTCTQQWVAEEIKRKRDCG